MSTRTARLELRIAPQSKRLIERAAELSNTSVTRFVTDTVLARARELIEGPPLGSKPQPRPVGGWSFELPDDWDEPLDDMADYR